MKPASIALKDISDRGQMAVRRQVHILTPVFGGGVHVEQDGKDDPRRHFKHADPVTPLRSASIRGHLRFWWRAIHGCLAASVAEMRERENKLWGSSSSPGLVSLRLGDGAITLGAEVQVFEPKETTAGGVWNPRKISHIPRGMAYGAFPLQPKGSQPKPVDAGTLHTLQGEVELLLICPRESGAEVADAIDAWLTFGGFGGRTRRGFGAVAAPDLARPSDFLKRAQSRCPNGTKPLRGVPSLHGARLAVSPSDFASARDALSGGLDSLQQFRQGAKVGRNEPQNDTKKPAGRSRWPEPETLRVLTKSTYREHQQRFVKVNKFPRAMFGMPIIFHFPEKTEPPQSQLLPQNANRLASPLILRPFLDDKKYRCLALVLREDSRTELKAHLLVNDLKDPIMVEHQLTTEEASRIRPLRGMTDPLQAFLQHFTNPEVSSR